MDDVERVFERWKMTMGHTRARLDPKRAKAIRAMLAIGYTVEDLELAIFGCSISPFHQGQNERGQKYHDVALICRDAEHVDKFISLAERAVNKALQKAQERPAEPLPARSIHGVPAHIMALVKR